MMEFTNIKEFGSNGVSTKEGLFFYAALFGVSSALFAFGPCTRNKIKKGLRGRRSDGWPDHNEV
jgi:hypothetical protein